MTEASIYFSSKVGKPPQQLSVKDGDLQQGGISQYLIPVNAKDKAPTQRPNIKQGKSGLENSPQRICWIHHRT